MAIFKCKMCGGALEIAGSETVIICEYCGTQQTLPKLNDEKRANLYDRANHFRRNNDFDKAMGIYEKILNEDKTDSEAYWSLVLCRYGIEYVEDPESHKRIPTVNRAQFTSVYDDDNYKSALKYADGYQKILYEEEAKAINEIQKGILAISQNEEPFDVFICYKETDNSGRRTQDSVLANDLYHQLSQEGFKVFFSRITLEDKLGTAYEPYIFAALNSAKVMVVLGTKPEYFNAVWVRNEWSRYLALIKNEVDKILIPAYKDMDPYDLPEEFSHLQAQDMSKLGFMQDLIRGIKKLIQADEPKTTIVKETIVSEGTANTAPLLKRVFMFLEDGDWNSADEYCEKVLDIDPECAEAYLGKLMAELRIRKQESLKDCDYPFDDKNNYKKALRFADDTLKTTLIGYIEHINTRNINNKYCKAKNIMSYAVTENEYKEAVQIFESIQGWKDANEQIVACRKKIEEMKETEEIKRQKQLAEVERIIKKIKKIAIISASAISAVIAFGILLNTIIIPEIKHNNAYNNAISLMNDGEYYEAISEFTKLNGYKDSNEKINDCNVSILDNQYNNAVSLMNDGKYSESYYVFKELKDYKDSKDLSVKVLHNFIIPETISVGESHTVGLKADGTVVAVGDNDSGQCDVSDWSDIISVSAGDRHTVGLKADGSVVAVGYNDNGQCDVSDWCDIISVSAGDYHTVGLKADGSVVAVGDNDSGQCDVSDWCDIVSVSAGIFHTVGLKADGTVVAVGSNSYGQCNVSGWCDIVSVSARFYHTVGLKADGTVVAVGDNDSGQCDVSD